MALQDYFTHSEQTRPGRWGKREDFLAKTPDCPQAEHSFIKFAFMEFKHYSSHNSFSMEYQKSQNCEMQNMPK